MLLILIFVYNFFYKKYQVNFCIVYIFHIVLLHTCLAIKHYIGVLGGTQLCRFLTYATFYSLVACFAELIVVCYCFWRHLNKNKSNEETDDFMGIAIELQDKTNGHQQSTETENRKFDGQQDMKHRKNIYVLALAVPLVITIVVFIIDALINLYDFNQCFRIQFEIPNSELSYAVVPILALMAFGIVGLYQITIGLNAADRRNQKKQNNRMRYENYFLIQNETNFQHSNVGSLALWWFAWLYMFRGACIWCLKHRLLLLYFPWIFSMPSPLDYGLFFKIKYLSLHYLNC